MSDWTAGSLSGRRRRLSDDEALAKTATARNEMLATALRLVETAGLTVSLGHLSFEQVISESDVSRSTAYRVWPYKEDFYSDLLRELAGVTNPGQAAFDQGTVALAAKHALSRLPTMDTEVGRRRALVDTCRLGARQNFQKIYNSPSWQTYVALIATMSSLTDGSVQTDVERGLNQTELKFVSRMSEFYEVMTRFFGFKILDAVPDSLRSLTTLGAAVIEGLALNASIVPEVADHRFQADPFATGEVAEWSLPSLGFTSMVLGISEMDPAYESNWSLELVPLLEQLQTEK